jgi:hypothetical protein
MSLAIDKKKINTIENNTKNNNRKSLIPTRKSISNDISKLIDTTQIEQSNSYNNNNNNNKTAATPSNRKNCLTKIAKPINTTNTLSITSSKNQPTGQNKTSTPTHPPPPPPPSKSKINDTENINNKSKNKPDSMNRNKKLINNSTLNRKNTTTTNKNNNNNNNISINNNNKSSLNKPACNFYKNIKRTISNSTLSQNKNNNTKKKTTTPINISNMKKTSATKLTNTSINRSKSNKNSNSSINSSVINTKNEQGIVLNKNDDLNINNKQTAVEILKTHSFNINTISLINHKSKNKQKNTISLTINNDYLDKNSSLIIIDMNKFLNYFFKQITYLNNELEIFNCFKIKPTEFLSLSIIDESNKIEDTIHSNNSLCLLKNNSFKIIMNNNIIAENESVSKISKSETNFLLSTKDITIKKSKSLANLVLVNETNAAETSSLSSSSLSVSSSSFNNMNNKDEEEKNGIREKESIDSSNCDDHNKTNKPRPSYLFQPNCHIFGGCVDDDASDEFFISSGAVYNSWPYVWEPGYQLVPLINYVEKHLSKSISKINYSNQQINMELPSYWLDNFEINMIHTRENTNNKMRKRKKKKINSASFSTSASLTCSYEESDDYDSDSSDDSESIIEYKRRHALGLNYKCANLNQMSGSYSSNEFFYKKQQHSSSHDSLHNINCTNTNNSNNNNNNNYSNRMAMSYYNENKSNLNNRIRFLSQKRVYNDAVFNNYDEVNHNHQQQFINQNLNQKQHYFSSDHFY